MIMTQPVMRKELLTAIIDGSKSVARVEIQEVAMNVGIDAPLHLHPCPTVRVVTEGKIVKWIVVATGAYRAQLKGANYE